MRVLFAALAPLVAGCAAHWQGDYDRLEADLSRESRFIGPILRAAEPSTDPDLDKMLSASLDLDLLIRVAIDRNPELKELLARSKAGAEEVRRASSLNDPMFKVESEAVPIRKPLAFDRDQTNMFGLRQDFPFPGNLGLRGEAALRDAESMYQMFRDRQRDVVARVKRAYFEYYAMTKEIEIHLEHVRLLEEFEKISGAKFRTGQVSQQDVLKPQVELVMLHNDVLGMSQRAESAKAAINALLNRPQEAALGKPREPIAPAEQFNLQDLSAKAVSSRPDLLAAELRVRSTESSLKVANREATLPDFSVGADYWQMPGTDDAYGVMVSINLPWFTGKRRAEAAKMEHLLRAERAAVETARNRALFEVKDAFLRVEAARKSAVLFKGELIPRSNQSVDVSRANYEKDKASFLDLLDAERSLRDVKLKYYQALAQYEAAVADLERAVGIDLGRKP